MWLDQTEQAHMVTSAHGLSLRPRSGTHCSSAVRVYCSVGLGLTKLSELSLDICCKGEVAPTANRFNLRVLDEDRSLVDDPAPLLLEGIHAQALAFMAISVGKGSRKSIAIEALCLWARAPHSPPLSVLDEIMYGHQGENLDLAFTGAELEPPHPFSELLRQAFAPHLSALDVLLANLQCEFDDPRLRRHYDDLRAEWVRGVILVFAARYDLWRAG